MNKYIMIGAVVVMATTVFVSCENSSESRSPGEKIFRAKCTRCHGLDGKKGKKGAKDLNLSTKSLDYRINQIREGKDKMPSFSNRLTAEQIEAVAKYTIEHFSPSSDSTNLQ